MHTPTAPPGGTMAGDRWRGRLRRRYVTTFVLLVSLPLLAYGLVSATLTYRQQREALAAIQHAQADAAGARIQQFLHGVELQLGWLGALPWSASTAAQRRLEVLRALKQTPAITDLVLVDAEGRERVAESRLALTRIESLDDRSASPAVAGARARGRYHGDVYFRKGSEPFITVAVKGAGDGGVAIAELSLKYIWDVVSRIRIGEAGLVYVVDRSGRLIAHTDINLVLRNTDLSRQLQAFERPPGREADARPVQRLPGTQGVPVLASSVVLAPLGWRVVVEQPQQEADAPLWASVRGGLWVAAASGLLALAAALWSVWRLVRPLNELTAGAQRLGAGQLQHRIELHSGDELEQLGQRFNAMAAELQGSYAGLERQVQARTRELSDAMRAKSRLLAAASHDLRQPLHALNLMAAQLQLAQDPAERERLVRRVEQAIHAINALFDGLLDVSKLDAGVIRPELSSFAVQPLLDRMDMAHSASARAKGLDLRIRACDAWVHSDALLLERIVGNLVANAVRYTRSGAVLLACRRSAAGLRVGVWDTGIGIAADQRERIFEEFYRVDDARHGGHDEGLGLGLSIVARLSALLGHPLALRSTPGRGSCFSITVPLAAPQAPPAAPGAAPGPDGLAGRRVLVIDNNEAVRASTTGLLQGWGCEVQARAGWSPGEAVQPPPELLLVDMHLDDGVDGLSIVAGLRRALGGEQGGDQGRVQGGELPALVMTGDVSLATRERVAAAGLPLLEKPISALRLRAALTRLLQRA